MGIISNVRAFEFEYQSSSFSAEYSYQECQFEAFQCWYKFNKHGNGYDCEIPI